MYVWHPRKETRKGSGEEVKLLWGRLKKDSGQPDKAGKERRVGIEAGSGKEKVDGAEWRCGA